MTEDTKARKQIAEHDTALDNLYAIATEHKNALNLLLEKAGLPKLEDIENKESEEEVAKAAELAALKKESEAILAKMAALSKK